MRSKILGLVATALLGAGTLVLAPSPASAADCTTTTDANGHAVVSCTKDGGVKPGTYTGPYPEWDGRSTETGLVPACMNAAQPGDPDADLLCTGFSACPEPTANRWRIFTRPTLFGQPTGPWELQGTQCLTPDEATAIQEPPITIPQVVGEAMKVAPKPTAHIEPGAWSLVRLPNNYYVDSEPVTRTVNVLGQAIAITFTPTEHTWSFGDGITATGEGVAGAGVGEAGAVEHAYEAASTYDVTVSRGYDLSFALPGGAVNITNAFAIASPVATLPVREMQTRVDAVH